MFCIKIKQGGIMGQEKELNTNDMYHKICAIQVDNLNKTWQEIKTGKYVPPKEPKKIEREPQVLNRCNCGKTPKLMKGENRDGYGLLGYLHWIECECGMKTKNSYERDGRNNGENRNENYITEIENLWNSINKKHKT
jgi:hypothetical protein